MTGMTQEQLEQRIRTGIPVSSHMDFRILELTDTAIRVSGGGDENVNVHGTAFAGSLYSICALAVWGLVHSRLPEDARLVMAEGSIRYRKPVVGEIISECEILAADFKGFLNAVTNQGKGRLKAVALVPAEGRSVAAEFTGLVYASRDLE